MRFCTVPTSTTSNNHSGARSNRAAPRCGPIGFAIAWGICGAMLFSSAASAPASTSASVPIVGKGQNNNNNSNSNNKYFNRGNGLRHRGGEKLPRSVERSNNDDDGDDEEYSYDSIPWQPPPSDHHIIDEAARYEDLPPNIFSPTGRLHPVEAVSRASKAPTPSSNLLVAMKCRDGLLVLSTFPVSPHLDTRIAHGPANGNNDDDDTASTNTARTTKDDDSDARIDETSGNGGAHESTVHETTSEDDEAREEVLCPSLFLFDETCASTTTGPVLDIHPCMVAATAGNAIDNRIMRSKLLALGLDAAKTQGVAEEDVRAGRVARDLADQLQVMTQDIAASQKQRLGRMLAVRCAVLSCAVLCRAVYRV